MRSRGSVLIICVGLLSVLLALGLAFLARMRLSADDSRQIVREAQARLMLQAACHYLMETSRLGWAPPTSGMSAADAEAATLMECAGWTDVRDGSLGPRPFPLPPGTPQPSWWRASWPAYSSAAPPVPPPWWWTYGDAYPTAPGAWDAATSDTLLPAANQRRWPCPGAVVRIDAYRVTRPRYAVVPAQTLNPVVVPSVAAPATSWTSPFPGGVAALGLGINSGPYKTALFDPTLDAVLGRATGTVQQGTGYGALDPQPIAGTWTAFAAGDATPVTSSENLAWFRIYRETKADHDNVRSGSGDPAYDRVPLRGYNTFVIACGAGGTHGFRFWDASDPGYSPELEPLTASASGLFPDRALFEQLRDEERILWFRVEWSGFQGGNVDLAWTYNDSSWDAWVGNKVMYGRTFGANHLMLQELNGFGHMAWLQRLSTEPVRW